LAFIRDRQRAGIEAAKVNGVYKGRPVTFDRARIVILRKKGWAPRKSPGPWGASGAALKAAGLGWRERLARTLAS
jgi:DNA invertase Pin-like site-specific DNA recombinase